MRGTYALVLWSFQILDFGQFGTIGVCESGVLVNGNYIDIHRGPVFVMLLFHLFSGRQRFLIPFPVRLSCRGCDQGQT